MFFLEPLEGDVSATGDVTITAVVHNLAVWDPADRESEPAGLRRGHVAIELHGRELARCGRLANRALPTPGTFRDRRRARRVGSCSGSRFAAAAAAAAGRIRAGPP